MTVVGSDTLVRPWRELGSSVFIVHFRVSINGLQSCKIRVRVLRVIVSFTRLYDQVVTQEHFQKSCVTLMTHCVVLDRNLQCNSEPEIRHLDHQGVFAAKLEQLVGLSPVGSPHARLQRQLNRAAHKLICAAQGTLVGTQSA